MSVIRRTQIKNVNNHTLPHLAQQNHAETLFTQILFVYYLHVSRVKQIPMCCEMSYPSIVVYLL